MLDRSVTHKTSSGNRTHDGRGGYIEAPGSDATISLRIRPAARSEVDVGGRLDGRVTHFAYAQPGSGIVRNDQIVDGTKTYDVLHVEERTGGGLDHDRLFLEEVQAGA